MKENDFITITNIKEYIEIGMIKIGEVLHLKERTGQRIRLWSRLW